MTILADQFYDEKKPGYFMKNKGMYISFTRDISLS